MKATKAIQPHQRNLQPDDSQVLEVPTGRFKISFLFVDDLDRVRTADVSRYNYDLNHSLMQEIFSPKPLSPSNAVSNETLQKLQECKKDLKNQIQQLQEEVQHLQNAKIENTDLQ